VKTLMLVAAILMGLGATTDAREIFLLCHADGDRYGGGFDIRVDLDNSALTRYDRVGRSSRSQAIITADSIEYRLGTFDMRVDRKSGDWVGWSYTGQMAKGSCQITDDPRRLEKDLCRIPKPRY
jgi:hypothetical protein